MVHGLETRDGHPLRGGHDQWWDKLPLTSTETEGLHEEEEVREAAEPTSRWEQLYQQKEAQLLAKGDLLWSLSH